MKYLKIILASVLFSGLLLIFICYALFLFILPNKLNSLAASDKLSNYIKSKTAFDFYSENLTFKTYPSLKIRILAKHINLKSESDIIDLSDFDILYDLKTGNFNNIEINDIKIDGEEIKKIFPKKNENKKSKFKFDSISKMNVKNILYKSKDYKIESDLLEISENNIKLQAEINSPKLKDKIKIGNAGNIYLKDGYINLENYEASISNSNLKLNGKIKENLNDRNLSISGSDLPVSDLMQALLFYQKAQDPAKKFIENFYDFSGNIDVLLQIGKDGVTGKCIAKNLNAKTVMFKIPLNFPKADFLFEGKSIISKAEGFIGKEKIYHTLEIINLGSPDKEVSGFVTANLSDKFNYIPNLKIHNNAQLKLAYNIKHKINIVQYHLDLKEGTDLIYKSSSLGLRNKNRSFYAKTTKQGDNMTLDEYAYYLINGKEIIKILVGEGLFKRIDGKFKPQYIVCKTVGKAPVSFISNIVKYVSGGEFFGNLKYDFNNGKLFGDFTVTDTLVKNFFVKSAVVKSDENIVKIDANGTYWNEPFNCNINAKNGFLNGLTINNMNLFLNKFIIRSKPENNTAQNNSKSKKMDISEKVKEADVNINNWEINVNRIIKDKIIIDNIKLLGTLKNNLFEFKMPDVKFADGILNAKGNYNFSNDSSNIYFKAIGIDSAKVTEMTMDLNGEIEGKANASIKVNTKNKADDIKGEVSFNVDNGFLPKLGSMSFMIKNIKRIKISDLVNIDLTKRDALQSDISGSFNFDNSLIKNISITTQQSFLSTLIEGDYEIKQQSADLSLYGKYNSEAPKGVKILFVPLNLILKTVFRPENSMNIYSGKLNKIPSINASADKSKFFRIKLQGNLNKEKLKVEIKSIK